MNFYVYIYLDPRKPGKFFYDQYAFDHEPFYIGKGKGQRWKYHLESNKRDKNLHKINKINKIRKEGLEPIIEKIPGLTEQNAFNLEIELVEKIGRNDLDLGPLVNLTDGGEGQANPSEETRKKISESLIGHTGYWSGKKFSKEHCINSGKAKAGLKLNKEHKKKIGLANRKTFKIKDPKGKIYKVFGLKEFAKKYQLLSSGVSKLISGKILTHKGWTKP